MVTTCDETLLSEEVSAVAGVPLTTPARTAYDIGRRPGLVRAVQRLDALARVADISGVDSILERNRGARGIVQLREALPPIDAGAESPQETRTRLVLIRGGLPPPTTQIDVYDEYGVFVARVDMGWEKWRVAVEYEGAQHWTDPDQRGKTSTVPQNSSASAGGSSVWASICCAIAPTSSSSALATHSSEEDVP
jgi:hypothetical protein